MRGKLAVVGIIALFLAMNIAAAASNQIKISVNVDHDHNLMADVVSWDSSGEKVDRITDTRLYELRYDNTAYETSLNIREPEKYESQDIHDDFGTITFTIEETKDIDIDFEQEINIGKINMPENHQMDISSQKSACVNGKFVEHIFHFYGVAGTYDYKEKMDYVWLPDFDDIFVVSIYTVGDDDHLIGYEYLVDFFNGDEIEVDGLDLYVSGDKVSGRKTIDEMSKQYRDWCWTFSEGWQGETEGIPISIKLEGADYELYGNIHKNVWEEDEDGYGLVERYKYADEVGLDHYIYNNDVEETSIRVWKPGGHKILDDTGESYAGTLGEITFSSEENKPITVVYDKLITTGDIDIPKNHQIFLESKKRFCARKADRAGIGTYYVTGGLASSYEGDDEKREYIYLPDFADEYLIKIYWEDEEDRLGGYYYTTRLEDGDEISAKGYDIYVNGKKLGNRIDSREVNPRDDRSNCWSFSKGWWTLGEGYADGEIIEEIKEIEEIPEGAEVEIILVDKDKKTPVFPAKIRIDDEIKGRTDSDGRFVFITEPELPITFTAEKEGYKKLSVKITPRKSGSLEFEMEKKYGLFEIPAGYEKYVFADQIMSWVDKGLFSRLKAGYVEIHPHEDGIHQFSMPITTDDPEEMLREGVMRIRKILDTSAGKGWWESDYKVIEKKEGVCSDAATLTTSFGNSYHIPTRRVSIAWRDWGLNGHFGMKAVKHAFSESFIQGKGWINVDATSRVIVNRPEYYAGEADCIHWAKANWNTDEEEDVTRDYMFGKPCDEEYLGDDEADYAAPNSNARISFNVRDNEIDVVYREVLSEEASNNFRKAYNEGEMDIDMRGIANHVAKGFLKEKTPSNIKLKADSIDAKNIVAGIDFTVARSPYEDFDYEMGLSPRAGVIEINAPVPAIAYPAIGTKEISEGRAAYTGEFYLISRISLVFDGKGVGIVAEDEFTKAVADAAAAKVGGNSYSSYSEAEGRRIIVLGDEGKEEDISIIGDIFRLPAEVAMDFWESSDEVVLANAYDYDSVKAARDYAVQKKLPVLFIGPDGVPEEVEKAIRYLGATERTVKDPNKTIKSLRLKTKGAGATTAILLAIIVLLAGVGAAAYILVKKRSL